MVLTLLSQVSLYQALRFNSLKHSKNPPPLNTFKNEGKGMGGMVGGVKSSFLKNRAILETL